ncbi:MAG: alpha/beta hydrolase [Proteobacteria bacterium]|nr:alpha/beta hydrolase [Pseudomonadota bacterium]
MIRRIAFLLFVPLFVAATLAAPAGAQNTAEEVVTIPTREDVTVPFILLGPRTGDAPAVILFTGGRGMLDLAEWDGKGTPSKNFLVRSRKLFAAQGFLVAVPDAPSDLIGSYDGLVGSRTSEEHAEDIRAVIRYLRRFTQGPMFLVGTSRGTLSAVGIAAQARAGELGGIVLTSSVTRKSRSGRGDVYDAKLENIRVPVLLASHVDDACYATPFEDSPKLKCALTGSPSVEIKGFRGGGGYRGRECGARHAHGFRGIEAQVVDDIAAWIKRQAASAPKP